MSLSSVPLQSCTTEPSHLDGCDICNVCKKKKQSKEKRSIQLDVILDVWKLWMRRWGNFIENDYDHHSANKDVQADSVSEGLQEKTNTLGEDFRSFLNCKSIVNSERTTEAGMNVSKLASRMTK